MFFLNAYEKKNARLEVTTRKKKLILCFCHKATFLFKKKKQVNNLTISHKKQMQRCLRHVFQMFE